MRPSSHRPCGSCSGCLQNPAGRPRHRACPLARASTTPCAPGGIRTLTPSRTPVPETGASTRFRHRGITWRVTTDRVRHDRCSRARYHRERLTRLERATFSLARRRSGLLSYNRVEPSPGADPGLPSIPGRSGRRSEGRGAGDRGFEPRLHGSKAADCHYLSPHQSRLPVPTRISRFTGARPQPCAAARCPQCDSNARCPPLMLVPPAMGLVLQL
jgi:hypothetical protein